MQIVPSPVAAPPERGQSNLRQAAQQLEASFLAEMLKSAGFSSGASQAERESPFASFLTNAHAKAMVETGGIGLSELIFEALKEREKNAR